MTPIEQRATIALSMIVSLRMLGLMMVLPLFALSATQYSGASPALIGLALGAYGLTQAILQIPFGILSDRIGRKPVMVMGLLILAIGSIVAASSHSMANLIIGRVLQGGGAIGSTAIACLADLTSEKSRTKAMAILGVSIGLAFFLSMLIGPLLSAWFSLSVVFWITALFALVAILMVYTLLPIDTELSTQTPIQIQQPKPVQSRFKTLYGQPQLLGLNFGVFLLHALFTANFIVIPLILKQTLNLDTHAQWRLYLPVLCLALIMAFAVIGMTEKKQYGQWTFPASISILCLIECWFYNQPNSVFSIGLGLCLFFTVFSILEAMLPSMVSKIAPPENKGAAMGMYSSSQFLGIFTGGMLGGWVDHHYGPQVIFLVAALLALLWLCVQSNQTVK